MTSEQKLLQLIRRSPKDRKASAAGLSPTESAYLVSGIKPLGLWLHRGLLVAVVAMLILLVWRYSILRKTYSVPVAVDVTALDRTQEPEIIQRPRSFEEFKDIFLSRNVFQPAVSEASPEEQAVNVPVIAEVNLSQQYRIVGIVLGAQPTVIVENAQTSSTVFLSVGDHLDQAVVKEIQQNKVILEWNGQMIELKS